MDTETYVKQWMNKSWYGEQEQNIGSDLLEVLESHPENIVNHIDSELGEFNNRHPRYINFLLDVRNMVRPSKVEERTEECTPTEADSPSALVPSP